jgi:hypothetical protein
LQDIEGKKWKNNPPPLKKPGLNISPKTGSTDSCTREDNPINIKKSSFTINSSHQER